MSSNGVPIPNQSITIGSASATTNASGVFSFPNIPINTLVNVQLSRTQNASNGIDGVDILLMRRHLLGIAPITSKTRLFAGDVDGNQDLDAADILQLRRLIIGLRGNLPVASWRFMPSLVPNDANFPFNLTIPDVFQVTFSASTTVFDFIGIKMGDVDNSADADQ